MNIEEKIKQVFSVCDPITKTIKHYIGDPHDEDISNATEVTFEEAMSWQPEKK